MNGIEPAGGSLLDTMRSRATRAALTALVLLAAAAAGAEPLPGESRDGLILIPDAGIIFEPSALEEPLPEALDYARYDRFPALLPDELQADPEAARRRASDELLTAAGFGEYRLLYDSRDSDPDPAYEADLIVLGRIDREEEIPFALMEHDSERYDAMLWSAALSYGNLFVRIGESRFVVDLGALYELNLRLERDQPPYGTPLPALPATPVAAAFTRVEQLSEHLIEVEARVIISLNNPNMDPVTARVFLRPAGETLELVAYLIEELAYPNGLEYRAWHSFEGRSPPRIREEVLRSTPAGGNRRHYRIAVGEYALHRGRFVRSSAARTIWEDVLPRRLVVAEERVGVYDTPGGSRTGELEIDRRVEAVEPWGRIDSRDGTDGVWFRIRSGGVEGWVWGPHLAEPE